VQTYQRRQIQGDAYKDGPENIFCISGRARKFWTVLIGRATQKQNKKDKGGRATHISGPSLYATPVGLISPTGHWYPTYGLRL